MTFVRVLAAHPCCRALTTAIRPLDPAADRCHTRHLAGARGSGR
jgi:hypothetical protein